jgi:hypothetical protein
MLELDEVEFFHHILSKAEKAFRQSDVINLNSNWSYSVCGTPIYKGSGLIVGLNWGGGGSGEIFNAQINYPNGSDIENYPFIKRLSPFLKKYLRVEGFKHLNYSNLSFFRSPNVHALTNKDWELSRSLFLDYITYVQPAWIVLLGTTGLDKATKLLDLEAIERFDVGKKRVFKAYKAQCSTLTKFTKLFALPHPSARVPEWIRDQLWRKVFL